MKKIFFYFNKYTIANIGCFILDILLVYTFNSFLNYSYLPVIVSSFLFTSLILYILCNQYVFKNSPNSFKKSFSIFWIVVSLKLIFALAMITFYVEYLSIPPYLARLISGITEALVAFFIDYSLTFGMVKVKEKY